jgi:hypothetical protein
MKRKAIGWTLFGLFFAFPSAYADESSKAFYSRCIDTEIQHCRIKAERVESRSKRIRRDAEKAKEQAHYYETNRDALIQQIDRERVCAKNYTARRYLLDSYYESRLAVE